MTPVPSVDGLSAGQHFATLTGRCHSLTLHCSDTLPLPPIQCAVNEGDTDSPKHSDPLELNDTLSFNS